MIQTKLMKVVAVALTVSVAACGAAPDDGNTASVAAAETDNSCWSNTLAKQVAPLTCVESIADRVLYVCRGGEWSPAGNACDKVYPWCWSNTAGRDVPPRACVKSSSDGVWYQCGWEQSGSPWHTGVADGTGPMGLCHGEYGGSMQ